MALGMSATTLDLSLLHPILQRFAHEGRAGLLPALHAAQAQYGHISEPIADAISRALKVPLADVHGVIEFYALFYNEPVGQTVVRVCTDPSCGLRGGDARDSASARGRGNVGAPEKCRNGSGRASQSRVVGPAA